jgi:hypothetical protein
MIKFPQDRGQQRLSPTDSTRPSPSGRSAWPCQSVTDPPAPSMTGTKAPQSQTFMSRLGDDVDLAQSHKAVRVAIAAPVVAAHRAPQPLPARPCRPPNIIGLVQDSSASARRWAGAASGPAAEWSAKRGGPPGRRRSNAHRSPAGRSRPGSGGRPWNRAIRVPKVGTAGDEGAGAVDRVQDPAQRCFRPVEAELLAQHAVIRGSVRPARRASPARRCGRRWSPGSGRTFGPRRCRPGNTDG